MATSAWPCLRRALVAIVALLAISNHPARAVVPSPATWELTPYRIAVMFLVDPAVGFDETRVQAVADGLRARSDSLIGARWELERVPCPAPMAAALAGELAELRVDQLPKELLERDKLVLVRVSGSAGQIDLSAREFCLITRCWSPVVTRVSVWPGQLNDELFELLVKTVRTVALVNSADEKMAELRIRGGKLVTRDPTVLAVQPGAVLRPMVRFNDYNGQPRKMMPFEWTYLSVKEAAGSSLNCSISTGLRKPLTLKAPAYAQKLAIVVPPVSGGTRLELVARGATHDLLSGYEVYSHPPDDPKTVLVGRTASDGSLWIPVTDSTMQVLLIKSGGDFLARLPIVPGLSGVVQAEVADDRQRLRAEGVIFSLQEGLVDLVARRAVLVAKIKAAVDADKIDLAVKLVADLRQLRTQQDQYARLLRDKKQTIISKDQVIQRKIDKLFGDTEKLMAKFFDPRPLDEVEATVNKAERDAKAAAESPPAEAPTEQPAPPAEPAAAAKPAAP